MFRIYSIQYLAYILGITESEFHRDIKPSKLFEYKNELRNMGIDNPNIGLDKDFNIFYVDPTNSNFYFATNINIVSYI